MHILVCILIRYLRNQVQRTGPAAGRAGRTSDSHRPEPLPKRASHGRV